MTAAPDLSDLAPTVASRHSGTHCVVWRLSQEHGQEWGDSLRALIAVPSSARSLSEALAERQVHVGMQSITRHRAKTCCCYRYHS